VEIAQKGMYGEGFVYKVIKKSDFLYIIYLLGNLLLVLGVTAQSSLITLFIRKKEEVFCPLF